MFGYQTSDFSRKYREIASQSLGVTLWVRAYQPIVWVDFGFTDRFYDHEVTESDGSEYAHRVPCYTGRKIDL